MGIFDFVKDAGAKILQAAKDPAAAADALVKHVKTETGMGNVQVEVDGGEVKLSGSAATQADKEKIILAAGNVYGVTKVHDAIEVKAPAPEARMYTVKAGDTLSGIAKSQYGHANEYTKIFEANKPMLKDPDKIYPGQVLRIP